jgi:MoxR-like ATPase
MSDLYKSLTLNQSAELIGAIGDVDTVIATGEMGIGKSSMLKILAKKMPDHFPCYVDMTTKDVGDFLVPKIRSLNDVEVCSFIPNEDFGFHHGKPVIIMLDEIGKTNRAVMNASLCLMQERRLGVFKLPEGSIVFATTNLATEAIGDSLPPHARNRASVVKVRKPSAEEWIEWALDNDITPEVLLTVKQFPQMLASFEDFDKASDNEYIYDPRTPRPAFCTPRSLERASNIIKKAKHLGNDMIAHTLKGTIGNRATYDMLSMIQLNDELPAWDVILKEPEKAHIPKSPSAVCMLVYSAIQRVEKDTMGKWMKYLARLSKEQQGLFATSVMRTSKKTTVGTNGEFIKWATANNYLFNTTQGSV